MALYPKLAATTPTGTAKTIEYRYPGVLAIDWVPNFGRSLVNTDPLAIAGKEIYAKVRSAYSGGLDADGPDFMVYLMALDSIYAYIAYLKRIYRLLTAWSPNNYMTPEGLLYAMNFVQPEIEALRTDRVQLWQFINELVRQVSKFTCPATMDVMNRHYWMSDNVYTDANTVQSQFYIFNLIKVFGYSETPTINDPQVKASGLSPLVMPTYTWGSSRDVSAKGLYQFGLSLIQALIDWDDAYTINGYLKRAYEGTPMFTVDELGAGEVLIPIYNEEVLTQIENCQVLPYGTDFASANVLVQQNTLTNMLEYEPSFTVNKANAKTGQWLDGTFFSMRSDMPNAGEVIIASRLKAMLGSPISINNDAVYRYPVYAGTEVPVAIRIIFSTQMNTSIPTGPVGAKVPSVLTDTLVTSVAGYLAQFDWHPIIPLATSTAAAFMVLLGDAHNVSFVDTDTMSEIHRVCLLSELDAFANR